tara:strand:+ start:7634 stop:8032 length:399 start_codon:yes stop_codon:yes gene_type:complete
MSDLVRLSSTIADSDLDGQPTVRFTSSTEVYSVKIGETKSVFSPDDETVANLRDISDIISTAISVGVGTNYVLSYNAGADNFSFISPDSLVDSAVGSSSGPAGFSTSVINSLVAELDVQLDNKIDLDAGTWA